MEDFFDNFYKLEKILDIYSNETKCYEEKECLNKFCFSSENNLEKSFEYIIYLNESKYIEYINTQLDVVYWYSSLGKKNHSNKVMVYLISDMVKSKNYNAIDYVLYSVDIQRLNSSSMEALRRTTSKLKKLSYRSKFINELKAMHHNNELGYTLNERFMLEE